MDIILGIYAFVFFIANFKTSFNHLLVNGVTRKHYFISNFIFSILSTLILLVVELAVNFVCKLFNFDTNFLYSLLFSDISFAESIVCLISIIFLASAVGWLIGVLSYRYGTPMILAIIFVPQILITLSGIILEKLNILEQVSKAVMFYFGILDKPAPLVASLNFQITALIITVITWIFMRKMPVKA